MNLLFTPKSTRDLNAIAYEKNASYRAALKQDNISNNLYVKSNLENFELELCVKTCRKQKKYKFIEGEKEYVFNGLKDAAKFYRCSPDRLSQVYHIQGGIFTARQIRNNLEKMEVKNDHRKTKQKTK